MRYVIVAVIFFALGIALASSVPRTAESRLALSNASFSSVQQISPDQIRVYPDAVMIGYPGLHYARVMSNSMAPVITDTSTVLERVPGSASDVHVGDIISFYEPSVDDVVLHLVTEREESAGKVFFKTKGVANPQEDPWTVPFENVKGVMVGVLK